MTYFSFLKFCINYKSCKETEISQGCTFLLRSEAPESVPSLGFEAETSQVPFTSSEFTKNEIEEPSNKVIFHGFKYYIIFFIIFTPLAHCIL